MTRPFILDQILRGPGQRPGPAARPAAHRSPIRTGDPHE